MTEANPTDDARSTESALRRQLQACFVPFDERRAHDMVSSATDAQLLDVRRWKAPLAAAAAVVVIGGGAAAIATSVAHGGTGDEAGGGGVPSPTTRCPPSASRSTPAPSDPVSPTVSPNGFLTGPPTVSPAVSAMPCAPSGTASPTTAAPSTPSATQTVMPQQVELTAAAPTGGGPGSASLAAPLIAPGIRFVLTGFDLVTAHKTSQITFAHADALTGMTVVVGGGARPSGPADTSFPAQEFNSDDPLTIRMQCTEPGPCEATLSLRGHFEKAG